MRKKRKKQKERKNQEIFSLLTANQMRSIELEGEKMVDNARLLISPSPQKKTIRENN